MAATIKVELHVSRVSEKRKLFAVEQQQKRGECEGPDKWPKGWANGPPTRPLQCHVGVAERGSLFSHYALEPLSRRIICGRFYFFFFPTFKMYCVWVCVCVFQFQQKLSEPEKQIKRAEKCLQRNRKWKEN